jgi:uncharacterized protein YbjT (DUF2867 family)
VILVTGGAGKTGLAVIRALHGVGISVRAMVHRPASSVRAQSAGADEVLVGKLEKRADLERALRSVDTVYAICPNMAPDEYGMLTGLIDAAGREGVKRFVYHSVLHPQVEAMPHHWQKLRVEERLFESGLEATILQPASYMQNLKGYWDEVVGQGVYRVPYPVETRLSLVDLDDVAQAAALVLSQDGHVGATYELCGPDALTQDQVAATLGQALGREVEAQELPLAEWLARPEIQTIDAYQRQTLTAMFRYYAAYGLVGNPNALAWLLDRAPTNLSQVVARDFLGQS